MSEERQLKDPTLTMTMMQIEEDLRGMIRGMVEEEFENMLADGLRNKTYELEGIVMGHHSTPTQNFRNMTEYVINDYLNRNKFKFVEAY